MKKNILLSVIILVNLFTFSGCKKGDDGPPKDYVQLVTNSIWSGEFNYAGKAAQPLSLSFQEGGKAYWIELLMTRTGTWTVNNGILSVDFTGSKGFKATIGDDNSLSSIQNLPANGFSLTSATLNSLTDPLLDNTNWTGNNIALHFKSNNKLDMELGSTGTSKYTNVNYSRYAKSIYFTVTGGYNWFIVLSGAQTIKGSNQFFPDPTIYVYQLNKQ